MIEKQAQNIRERVMSIFSGKAAKPLSLKEVAYLAEVGRSEQKALKKLLSDLIKTGSLVMTRRGLYGPPDEMSLLTGRFQAHRDGYGFLIPEKSGQPDMFIPPRATLGALDGDRVLVRVENAEKREGRIIRVLARGHTKIAGIIEVGRTACFVRPKNRSMRFDVHVPPKEKGGAKDGDTVIVEITSYPTESRQPTGRVIKVLTAPEDPAQEVEMIVEEFNLPRRFPRDAASEAKSAYEKDLGGKRKDMRSVHTVTIDGERAKDFDDAVSIRLNEHGYTLFVHIADVGHYVGWNGPLDIEARSRATSVYFPDRVIPMLPKELSEDLCSLRPGIDRPAFTVEMRLGRSGEAMGADFYPSLIKSDARLTYTSVAKMVVDRDEEERKKYPRLIHDIELMAELAGILRSKRLGRGSLDFDLPEPEVLLDLTGRPEAIVKAERNFAHMMIEEFMIAANEAVAGFLEGIGAPCIYRVHEPPDPMRLDEMWRVIRPAIGAGFKSAMKGGLKPEMFSRVLNSIKGSPGEEIVNHIILRSMKQARYSTENAGHFGLASKSYAHFTSPIRRYPDLVVHRILREVLHKKRLSEERASELMTLLADIASHSSHMERISDQAEREVVDAMRVWFMKDKVGDEFAGHVAGVTPYGLKVRLEDFYVEGFLHVSSLTDDFYVYSEDELMLKGRNTKKTFSIGQRLTVRVEKIDMMEREIAFGAA